MKQNLREAELALARKRAEMTLLEVEERSLREELLSVDKRARALDEQVALALQDGNEAHARFSIRRLLPQRETQRGLEARIDTVGGRIARLCETLAAQEESFVELKSRVRARLLAHRRAVAGGDASVASAIRLPVPDEAVEVELLRRQREVLAEAGAR